MKIGDKVMERPEFGLSGGSREPPIEGTVVGIDPKGRTYTVEFKFKYGSFRQSFFFPEYGGND